MAIRRPALVAYDVSDNRRRRRLFRLLLGWRTDGQLSVHECRLSAVEAEELFLQMRALIDPETDRLLLAWVDPHRPVHYRGAARPKGPDPGLRLYRPSSLKRP